MFEKKSAYTASDLDRLTRFAEAEAKLPTEQLALVDEILSINDQGGRYGKGEVLANFRISPDLWFFRCHFPGDPVMPGCLGLDALWQLAGFYLSWSGRIGLGRALGVGEVKFFGEILPHHSEVRYHVHVKRILQREMTMILADGQVEVDGTEIYSASNLRVALLPRAGDKRPAAAAGPDSA